MPKMKIYVPVKFAKTLFKILNISKGILIGVIADVLTSGAIAISYDFSQAKPKWAE